MRLLLLTRAHRGLTTGPPIIEAPYTPLLCYAPAPTGRGAMGSCGWDGNSFRTPGGVRIDVDVLTVYRVVMCDV